MEEDDIVEEDDAIKDDNDVIGDEAEADACVVVIMVEEDDIGK